MTSDQTLYHQGATNPERQPGYEDPGAKRFVGNFLEKNPDVAGLAKKRGGDPSAAPESDKLQTLTPLELRNLYANVRSTPHDLTPDELSELDDLIRTI